jgi:hypothetical protein
MKNTILDTMLNEMNAAFDRHQARRAQQMDNLIAESDAAIYLSWAKNNENHPLVRSVEENLAQVNLNLTLSDAERHMLLKRVYQNAYRLMFQTLKKQAQAVQATAPKPVVGEVVTSTPAPTPSAPTVVPPPLPETAVKPAAEVKMNFSEALLAKMIGTERVMRLKDFEARRPGVMAALCFFTLLIYPNLISFVFTIIHLVKFVRKQNRKAATPVAVAEAPIEAPVEPKSEQLELTV